MRKIVVRRFLHDRRQPAPQADGRIHEARAANANEVLFLEPRSRPASRVALSKSSVRRGDGSRQPTLRRVSIESVNRDHPAAGGEP